jgi:predicted metal-dependent phosphoesterase TrpH
VIDLHSHTRHSDGQRTPAELLAEAAEAGVRVLAVTDHDTVSGIEESQAAAAAVGLRLVPGIELSAQLHGREVHVLGHLIDARAPALLALQGRLLEERRERMERMVARAQELRLGITWEQVLAHSGGANLGRPHLARALVDAGHARSVKEAFEKWVGSRGPLYVARRWMPAAEAIALVHRSGGTASLAHPGANRVSKEELALLADAGLDAVEALHPEHVPTQAEAYERWGAAAGLLVTAGSDFHGPAVQPGRKLGDRTLPADRFAALEERARRWSTS